MSYRSYLITLCILFFVHTVTAQNILIKPADGLKVRKADNALHIIVEGDTPEHVTGNVTLLGKKGTQTSTLAEAKFSFSDVPDAFGWLPVRLDRKAVCPRFGAAPYPDADAACVILGATASGGAGVCVGSGIPFGFAPPQADGGLYDLLYVIEGVNGTWSVTGQPEIILPPASCVDSGDGNCIPLTLNTPITLDVASVKDSKEIRGAARFIDMDGNSQFRQVSAQISNVPDSSGETAFGAISHPNMTCLPDKGQRQVDLFSLQSR